MNKLIKLTKDHYVVVDDSEIKEGDWYYWEVTKTIQIAKLDSLNRFPKSSDGSKKITHSTQPFNNRPHFAQYGLITLSEVKELIGEVDVEKKAEYDWMLHTEGSIVVTDKNDWKSGFHHGYNQALEDNKEKKYTEEDLRKAIQLAWEADSIDGTVDLNIVLHYGDNNDLRTKWSEDEIIKSLQPKTEWEVEIVDGKLKLKL